MGRRQDQLKAWPKLHLVLSVVGFVCLFGVVVLVCGGFFLSVSLFLVGLFCGFVCVFVCVVNTLSPV